MNYERSSNLIDLSYSAQYEAHLYYNIIHIYIVYILYHLCFCIWSSNERRRGKKKKKIYKKEYRINEQKVNRKYIIYLSKIVENWYYPRLAGRGKREIIFFVLIYLFKFVSLRSFSPIFLRMFVSTFNIFTQIHTRARARSLR